MPVVLSARVRLSVLTGVLLLSACSRPEPAPEPLRAVKLLTVGLSAVQTQLEYPAEVRAQQESRLGFRVAGKLLQRPVQLGQRVQAGQLLAQLDASDYQLAAQAAQAQVAAASTQRDLAQADWQRFSALKEQNFISPAELDRRQASLKAAQATLQQAQAQAQAQAHQAQYTRLLADVAGVVTAVEAEPGQVLGAGQTVLRIARDGARDAAFYVPEDRVGSWQVGQTVQVRAWGSGQQWSGRVREVAASADPVTRSFLVKVQLQGVGAQTGQSGSAPALGATVYVSAQALAVNMPVLRLPTTALHQESGNTAVWVFEPQAGATTGTVRLQPVQVATADGNEVVLAGGLTPGMQVVATGVHVLVPGQQVLVYQDKSAAPKALPQPPAQSAKPSGVTHE